MYLQLFTTNRDNKHKGSPTNGQKGVYMKFRLMNLQLFADGEAAAAPAGGGAETVAAESVATEAPAEFRVGDTLGDGSKVTDVRVAAALNRQMKRHPEMRQVYGQNQQPIQQGQPQQMPEATADGQTGADDLNARWEQAINGEFKELYGQGVQKAVMARVKNLKAAEQQLQGYQPIVDALMKKTGAADLEELTEIVVNDQELLAQEAEEHGMTEEAWKQFRDLQTENQQYKAAEQAANQQRWQQEILRQEAEMQKIYPQFSLTEEMQNEEFRGFIAKGLSVKQAFNAIHADEIQAQAMNYGMERARQQMGQTIAAQRSRPTEGAANGKNPAAAEPKLNPANLTRKERERFKQMARRGVPVSFD